VLLKTIGLSRAAVARDKPSLFQCRSASIRAAAAEIDHEANTCKLEFAGGTVNE